MGSESTGHSISGNGRYSGLIRQRSLWRPRSLAHLVSNDRALSILQSQPSTHSLRNSGDAVVPTKDKQVQKSKVVHKESNKKGWSTIVAVVIVEARGLPDPPSDGSHHTVFCKVRLGSDTYNSKSVRRSRQPIWRERCKLRLNKDHFLKISLWDKGKHKHFMGSCVIDLGSLGKERAHDIWQVLDDGFGAIHLNVTMCAIRNSEEIPNGISNADEAEEKFTFLDFEDWQTVGQLHVKVVGARGLFGKPYAYCTLELHNQKVQTPSAKAGPDPTWEKSYVFNVHDVMTTLDVNVCDSSLVSNLGIWTDHLGRVSIPLYRIQNGETRWYALKDKSKRSSAKGNCPRILLEISMVWNPLKASLRLFRPVEAKYISKKPPKFHMNLVYANVIFVRDSFLAICEFNEIFKSLFEWENKELCAIALLGWLIFWYNMRLWMTPLLFLIPFLYFMLNKNNQRQRSFMRQYSSDVIEAEQTNDKVETSLTSKIQGLPDVTITVASFTEYLATTSEKFYNLVSFKVPFLSYLAMIILIMASVVLYWIPFNFLMMALGIYKYSRKALNPERILNNDLLDFISRIPDNETLKDWEELNVPEPPVRKDSSLQLAKTNGSVSKIE